MILRSVVRRAALQNHSAGHPSSAIGQLSLHDMWIMNYKKTKKKKNNEVTKHYNSVRLTTCTGSRGVLCSNGKRKSVEALLCTQSRTTPPSKMYQTNQQRRKRKREGVWAAGRVGKVFISCLLCKKQQPFLHTVMSPLDVSSYGLQTGAL